nr:MAG TPA: hypothetical protein [Caudoviricetes sp.]
MTAMARIIVDGVDTFDRFGVFALEAGLNDLLAYPPLKPVEANDWHEQEGLDADLSAPRLNGREVTIKIGATGTLGAPQTIAKIDDFLAFLRQRVYRVFRFAFLGGREYTLRLVGEPNLTIAQALGFVTLKFADDYPMKGYAYKSPQSSMQTATDYLMQGRPFTAYGARVTEGTLAEFARRADVKIGLTRNIATAHGIIGDDRGVVRQKSKEVKVRLHFRAETLAELWRNYDALLYDLTRPGARIIRVRDLGNRDYQAYYKSAQVTAFYPDDRPWLDTTLTLVVLSEPN